MKGLETLEQQRLFLKAVGTVLANDDLGLIKDTGSIEYGSRDGFVFDFKIGFSSDYRANLGQKIVEECRRIGLEI